MTNRLKTFIGLTALLLSCSGQKDYCRQAETIVGRHVVKFTCPPQRIPSDVSVDAPLLGNGFTGVALSGNPERQVFYVARNDFWRLKHGHNESYPTIFPEASGIFPKRKTSLQMPYCHKPLQPIYHSNRLNIPQNLTVPSILIWSITY